MKEKQKMIVNFVKIYLLRRFPATIGSSDIYGGPVPILFLADIRKS